MTTNRKRVCSDIDVGPLTAQVAGSLEAGLVEEFLRDERIGRSG